jgi:hypothetical protein
MQRMAWRALVRGCARAYASCVLTAEVERERVQLQGHEQRNRDCSYCARRQGTR